MHVRKQKHIHSGGFFPEFYDDIIRLPIPISKSVLMMIGVLPMHPSPHVFHLIVGCMVVGRLDRGLGRVAHTVLQ